MLLCLRTLQHYSYACLQLSLSCSQICLSIALPRRRCSVRSSSVSACQQQGIRRLVARLSSWPSTLPCWRAPAVSRAVDKKSKVNEHKAPRLVGVDELLDVHPLAGQQEEDGQHAAVPGAVDEHGGQQVAGAHVAEPQQEAQRSQLQMGRGRGREEGRVGKGKGGWGWAQEGRTEGGEGGEALAARLWCCRRRCCGSGSQPGPQAPARQHCPLGQGRPRQARRGAPAGSRGA